VNLIVGKHSRKNSTQRVLATVVSKLRERRSLDSINNPNFVSRQFSENEKYVANSDRPDSHFREDEEETDFFHKNQEEKQDFFGK